LRARKHLAARNRHPRDGGDLAFTVVGELREIPAVAGMTISEETC
jgi:hypothetical protein